MNKFSVSTKFSVGYYECKDCGWPVIFACCNHPFTIFKDASTHDCGFIVLIKVVKIMTVKVYFRIYLIGLKFYKSQYIDDQ